MEKRKHYVQETKEDKAMVMDKHLDIMCDFNRITSMANNIRDLQAMSAYQVRRKTPVFRHGDISRLK